MPSSSSSRSSPANGVADPAELARQRVRARQLARAAAANPPSKGDDDPLGAAARPSGEGVASSPISEMADTNGPNSSTAAATRRRARSPDPDLEEVGSTIKRQKKLSAESEAELLSFSKVRCAQRPPLTHTRADSRL
jgi:hypothetical protein